MSDRLIFAISNFTSAVASRAGGSGLSQNGTFLQAKDFRQYDDEAHSEWRQAYQFQLIVRWCCSLLLRYFGRDTRTDGLPNFDRWVRFVENVAHGDERRKHGETPRVRTRSQEESIQDLASVAGCPPAAGGMQPVVGGINPELLS